METILQMRELVRRLYSKFEVYVAPVLKFLLAFIFFSIINGKLGYMPQINNIAIVLMASLLCSFLPTNLIVILGSAFAVAHIYKLSLECAACVLVLLLVLFLVYFRFAPKDAIVMILTPIAYTLGVPVTVPIAAGLLGGPGSAVSVACGTAFHYIITFVSENKEAIEGLADDGALEKVRYLADGLLNNKAMLISMISFAITVIVVFLVRRIPTKFAWFYAMGGGVLINMIIQLVGGAKFDTGASFFGILISSIVAVALGIVLKFFVFDVNFEQTENVQFEDDDYYYFVKAVPKRKSVYYQMSDSNDRNGGHNGGGRSGGHPTKKQIPQKSRPTGAPAGKSAAYASHNMDAPDRIAPAPNRSARTGQSMTGAYGASQTPAGVRTTPTRSGQSMTGASGASQMSSGMRPSQSQVPSQSGISRASASQSASPIQRAERPITARTPSTASRQEAKRAAQQRSLDGGLETIDLKDE